MPSGDGLLLRIRPRGPALSSGALAAIAGLAERYGNGQVETTRRANLQLRGVRPGALDAIRETLGGLGLIDTDAKAEAVRNIVVSPLAGIDPSASIDGATIAAGIEAGLAADDALHRLPAKFSFLVDEGAALPLDDIVADIRLTGGPNGVAISLGGRAAVAVRVALLDQASAAGAALRIAAAFLSLTAGTGIFRMDEALARFGLAQIADAAGLAKGWAIGLARPSDPVRARDLYGRQAGFFGVGAAFGSFEAGTLARLAELAPAGIRLTPWRCILLPALPEGNEAALASLPLVTRADDPQLRVAACVGAPACGAGQVSTRDVAIALAARLPAGDDDIALHVSGCAKGCARSASTPLTLVGRDGRFDLVVNGRADGRPVRTGLRASDLQGALDPARSPPWAVAS